MPNCMKEGWGQAGVWKSPIGGEQDRPFVVSKRMLTPLHPQTRPSAPRNSLPTGGLGQSTTGAFKITLGSSCSAPSLSAWMEEERNSRGVGNVNLSLSLSSKAGASMEDLRPAGGSGIYFGSRPMWATESDKARKAATFQGRNKSMQSNQQKPISLQSPAEQQYMNDLAARAKRREATPETLTPASSRPASSGASRASAERRRSGRENSVTIEATGTPLATMERGQVSPGLNPAQRLNKLLSQSFKSHCVCYGNGVTDSHLLDLPEQSLNETGALDYMIRRSRNKGDFYAGNAYKGSKGTMLGA